MNDREPREDGGDRAAVRRPWLPSCLPEGFTDATVKDLSYLVVEEMVEDITAITITPWPAADGYGRLRFETDVDRVAEVAVLTAVLFEQVYRARLRRRPHVGDVFAARVDLEVLAEVRGEEEGVWDGPLVRLLRDGVYDLSAEARKVAKLAFYSVRSDILPEGDVAKNLMKAKEEQGPGEAVRHEVGVNTSGGGAP